MRPSYQDFFVVVDGSAGQYTVAAQGPEQVTVAPVPSTLPETETLRTMVTRLQQLGSLSRTEMEALGTTLFEALFPRPIFRAFERSRSVLPPGANLRLKLVIRPSMLSYLPWEFIFDPDERIFLAARLSYPLLRSIESRIPVASLLARRPIRVLYVHANPSDTQPLDLLASEQAVRQGLGNVGDITSIYHTTPELLRDTLRQSPGFHILHYDGHAEFDEATDTGYIALHDASGKSHWLSAELLATYLDGASIRLVVLAACETAVDSQQKRFGGVAHTLMRASSLPAVVANQFAVHDNAAIAFNRGFYGSLADDYPVDAATVEGRKAILDLFGGSADAAFTAPDWATPVLFMRTSDGRIFDEQLSKEDMMSDNEQGSRTTINTGGGASLGNVNTGGGDFVGRDKHVHGDEVRGNKIGTQRNVTMESGDYAEGNIDKRQGAFVSGGTVYGPVVGSNNGTISTSYGGLSGGNAAVTPLQQLLDRARQAQQMARQRGEEDLADDLDSVTLPLAAALKAQEAGKLDRRAEKLREAQQTLLRLATSNTYLNDLVQQMGRLA